MFHCLYFSHNVFTLSSWATLFYQGWITFENPEWRRKCFHKTCLAFLYLNSLITQVWQSNRVHMELHTRANVSVSEWCLGISPPCGTSIFSKSIGTSSAFLTSKHIAKLLGPPQLIFGFPCSDQQQWVYSCKIWKDWIMLLLESWTILPYKTFHTSLYCVCISQVYWDIISFAHSLIQTTGFNSNPHLVSVLCLTFSVS